MAELCHEVTFPLPFSHFSVNRMLTVFFKLQFGDILSFKAGLKDLQFTLALEPEVASVYCRKIPVEIDTQRDGAKQIASLPQGAKYLVLDLGG